MKSFYQKTGIPTFLLVDENFSVITRNGLNMLLSNPNGYPWPRKPLYELCEFTAHLLSEMPSLILFTGLFTIKIGIKKIQF
jgi:hypothetical protein